MCVCVCVRACVCLESNVSFSQPGYSHIPMSQDPSWKEMAYSKESLFTKGLFLFYFTFLVAACGIQLSDQVLNLPSAPQPRHGNLESFFFFN